MAEGRITIDVLGMPEVQEHVAKLEARIAELEEANYKLEVEVGELRRLVFDIEPVPQSGTP